MAGGRAGQGMKISADAEMHFIEKRLGIRQALFSCQTMTKCTAPLLTEAKKSNLYTIRNESDAKIR